MEAMTAERIKGLRRVLKEKKIGALLVTKPENIYYLTGFSGSSGSVLVTSGEVYLLTDFRYDEQARQQCPGSSVICITEPLHESLAHMAGKLKLVEIAFEMDYMTFKQAAAIKEVLHPLQCQLTPVENLVEGLRIIKDAGEIGEIKEACEITDLAFEHITHIIRAGITEGDLALELEFFMRKNGATAPAFPIIVASGPRSAMPHGTAGSRIIQEGDLVKMDFGARVDFYNSDMTRTVVVGAPSLRQREIYNIVLEAQLAAIARVAPGALASHVDGAARDIIAARGFAENFGHGTGHGLGLDVHEDPRLSTRDHRPLEPGMVVTVEPGIYIPGWGGVRIEDTVLVTDSGCQILTASPKMELMPCGAGN